VVELIKCTVDIHALFNIDLFLLHLGWETVHDLLNGRKLLNVVWDLFDLNIVEFELFQEFIRS
jgi:hypothetical protein